MSKIISIHSFRRGTGKTNIIANVAALFVLQGLRVGVIDTDLRAPGVHIPLNLDEDKLVYTLNDYLQGKCDIEQAAYEITSSLRKEDEDSAQKLAVSGQLFIVPSSTSSQEMKRVTHENYDAKLLSDGFTHLIEKLELDALLLDTHAGVNDETLAAIAPSDVLIILLRPDQQDYQGTSLVLEIAQKLDIPRTVLVINQVVSAFDRAALKEQVERAYNCKVAEVLSLSEDMMLLASAGIFVLQHPEHPMTISLKHLTKSLMAR